MTGLLIAAFVPGGPLVVALDDTLERRRGAHIAAKGIYRDPVRSSESHFVKASGLRWVCLMLLVPIPWAQRVWALPFLTVLGALGALPHHAWPAAQDGARLGTAAVPAPAPLVPAAPWWSSPIASMPPWSCWPAAAGRRWAPR